MKLISVSSKWRRVLYPIILLGLQLPRTCILCPGDEPHDDYPPHGYYSHDNPDGHGYNPHYKPDGHGYNPHYKPDGHGDTIPPWLYPYLRGKDGRVGRDGEKGAKGDKGATGPQGMDGDAGTIKGEKGMIGDEGYKGQPVRVHSIKLI